MEYMDQSCVHGTHSELHLDACLHVTLSRELYSYSPFKLSNPFLVPLDSLFLVSCHRTEERRGEERVFVIKAVRSHATTD